jgi:hypothetical protein
VHAAAGSDDLWPAEGDRPQLWGRCRRCAFAVVLTRAGRLFVVGLRVSDPDGRVVGVEEGKVRIAEARGEATGRCGAGDLRQIGADTEQKAAVPGLRANTSSR